MKSIATCTISLTIKTVKSSQSQPSSRNYKFGSYQIYTLLSNTNRQNHTLKVTTLVIFHISIRRPMDTLTLTMKFVSLSRTYKTTMKDWKTLKKTDRTDRPSRDLRFFQNCMSEEKRSNILHEKSN